MSFLKETSSLTIANSRLAFIFPNGSITHNQTSVYFQSPTPTPMRVPNDCSFNTLKIKSRMHNTLQLTNDQLMDEIYYRQPFIDDVYTIYLQLKNDDDVYTILMCNEQYSCVGPIELLCTINKTHRMVYSTCFNPISLLLMMHLCITTGSETYHTKVGFWVTPSLEQIQ